MVLSGSWSRSFDDAGIDVEHHRHLARLARLHGLLGEAEAVDLVEIGADRRRRDIIRGLRGDGARRFVDDLVVDGRHLADVQLDRVLLRQEYPRQAGRDVGIEADGQLAGELVLGRDARDLRGAGKAGDAAEHAVERDRGKGQRPPSRRPARRSRRRSACRAADAFFLWRGVVVISAAPARSGLSPASSRRTGSPARPAPARWRSNASAARASAPR